MHQVSDQVILFVFLPLFWVVNEDRSTKCVLQLIFLEHSHKKFPIICLNQILLFWYLVMFQLLNSILQPYAYLCLLWYGLGKFLQFLPTVDLFLFLYALRCHFAACVLNQILAAGDVSQTDDILLLRLHPLYTLYIIYYQRLVLYFFLAW